MIPLSFEILGSGFGLSELLLAFAKRSKGASVSKDRGSLMLLWVVILGCIGLANASVLMVPRLHSARLHDIRFLGAGLVAAGLALRWYSIIHLGRFFTVNVSITADQRVVDTGPYSLVRHPSYSGALVAFLGLGICSENYLALLVLVLPVTVAFLRRIAIEEAVLNEALGRNYSEYSGRTKRLIPWIY
jgi:protein-S-isoprenylcysteine O-methyltransferase